jgi:hypothetical protein
MYARDGVQRGPVTSKDLQALATRGELLPTDVIWKEGMKGWVRADKSSVVFPAEANVATKTSLGSDLQVSTSKPVSVTPSQSHARSRSFKEQSTTKNWVLGGAVLAIAMLGGVYERYGPSDGAIEADAKRYVRLQNELLAAGVNLARRGSGYDSARNGEIAKEADAIKRKYTGPGASRFDALVKELEAESWR